MSARHAHLDRVLAHLRALGASAIRIERTTKHLRIVFIFEGETYWRMLPSTPGTQHGFRPIISEINHMLGLVGAPRATPRRALRKKRRTRRAPVCPFLSSLPDWRDDLRRLYG